MEKSAVKNTRNGTENLNSRENSNGKKTPVANKTETDNFKSLSDEGYVFTEEESEFAELMRKASKGLNQILK